MYGQTIAHGGAVYNTQRTPLPPSSAFVDEPGGFMPQNRALARSGLGVKSLHPKSKTEREMKYFFYRQ